MNFENHSLQVDYITLNLRKYKNQMEEIAN